MPPHTDQLFFVLSGFADSRSRSASHDGTGSHASGGPNRAGNYGTGHATVPYLCFDLVGAVGFLGEVIHDMAATPPFRKTNTNRE